MPAGFQSTGGALLASVNATWPFATLTAIPEELRLRVRLLGDYRFRPAEVRAVTASTTFFGRGVQIHHTRPDAPAKIVFWPMGAPEEVVAAIAAAGFRAAAPAEMRPTPGGWPLRPGFTASAILGWNTLIALDFFGTGKFVPLPGFGSVVAIGLAALVAAGILRHEAWQRLALKPGRHVGEIRPHLRLFLAVAGSLGIMFGFFTLLRLTVLGPVQPP